MHALDPFVTLVVWDKYEKLQAVCRHEGFRRKARPQFVGAEDGLMYLKKGMSSPRLFLYC